jgi:hypothetical protein
MTTPCTLWWTYFISCISQISMDENFEDSKNLIVNLAVSLIKFLVAANFAFGDTFIPLLILP